MPLTLHASGKGLRCNPIPVPDRWSEAEPDPGPSTRPAARAAPSHRTRRNRSPAIRSRAETARSGTGADWNGYRPNPPTGARTPPAVAVPFPPGPAGPDRGHAMLLEKQPPVSADTPIGITLTINGQRRELQVAPWTTLLDVLRERLDLTGTKKGCDHGQCGACTVLVNGTARQFLPDAGGDEGRCRDHHRRGPAGLGDRKGSNALHPIQEAFIEHDAFQCGYCTPGPDLLGGRPDERGPRPYRATRSARR